MADEITKVLEYILNNETFKTIGIVYFIFAAIIAVLGITVIAIALKLILSTMKTIKNYRKW